MRIASPFVNRPFRFEPLEERALLSVWTDLTPEIAADKGASPTVQLAFTSSEFLCGVVKTPGVWVDEIQADDRSFSELDFPDGGHFADIGAPSHPVIRRLLAVPKEADIRVTVVDTPRRVPAGLLGLNSPLVPAQPAVEKDSPPESSSFHYDAAAYSLDGFAVEPVRVAEAGTRNGIRYVSLEIAPLTYNPVQNTFAVYDTLTFTLSLSGGSFPVSAKGETPLGGGLDGANTKSGVSRFLVVAHDDFAATQTMVDYVTHKTSLGWTVDLFDTSTTGTSKDAIRAFIQDRYANAETRPEAVLLVGDTDRIEAFTGSGARFPTTDLYYGCMDAGDDWLPELPVGRFSVADITELGVVVNKTIAYETSPGGEWTGKAVFIATSDVGFYDVAEGTHNWVIDTYMDPLGYSSDKLYAISHEATTEDVRDALDDGRVMAVYSGHGGEHSWVGPYFSESDVRALENPDAYPVVLSFACVTGDYAMDECFAETWLRETSGAINVFASSVNSLWTEDDILERKFFDAIYEEGISAVGAAALRAKEMYLDYFGPSQQTRGYFEQYNLFGDPTVGLLGLGFNLASDPVLPSAYIEQPYDFSFRTSGGGTVSSWSLVSGSLPPGLVFDTAEGSLRGTATQTGSWSFTVEATDSEANTAQGTFRLDVVSPLVVTTPLELPSGFVGVPYSVTLSAEGGLSPYLWSASTAGGYVETAADSGYLGGGTAMGWRGDDSSWSLDLPWEFSFYGESYDSVWVCTNGFLDFTSGTVSYSNSDASLKNAVRIAPLWDDLRTDTADGDIFVTQTEDYVAIRWQGDTYAGMQPVDMEAVLYRNGTVRLNYGQMHLGLTPTIGISAGNNRDFVLSSLNELDSIPADTTLDLAYESLLPPGLSFDAATATIQGTPTDPGDFPAEISVSDTSTPPQHVATTFSLPVSAFPPLAVLIPESATEGGGLLAGQGTVSLAVAASTDVEVSLASGDESEITLPQTTVWIPAGQLSATFDLVVPDDAVLDGSRWVTVTASAADYIDGHSVIAVHDNETASLGLSLTPLSAAEGDGSLAGAGTVTIDIAPDEDLLVTLASLDATEVACPSFVILPAGANSVSFDIEIVDDDEIDGTISAGLAASVVNWNQPVEYLDITDNDAFLALALPQRLWEGTAATAGMGRVSLGGWSSQDVTVWLTSSDPGQIAVAESVVIKAGRLFADFDMDVFDNALQDGSRSVTINATSPGLSGATSETTISDDELAHFAIDPVANPQTAAEPFVVTVAAKNIDGETIETFGQTASLTAVGAGGELPVTFSSKQAGPSPYEPFSFDGSSGSALGTKGTLGVYHDYAGLTTFLASYAADYAEICSLVSLGQSVQGRELWAVKISDNPLLEEDEPEFKYVSTMHGNERISLEMTLYLIDHLLTGYATDPALADIVNQTEIWIVPLMNPDGLEAGSRYNANGIDLNRAFPDGAVTSIGTVFTDPVMDFSSFEPEVAAVMQWGIANSATLSANLHSGALLVNYPYDNDGLGSVDSPSPDDALFEFLSETYSSHNLPMWNSPSFPHGITNGAAWYSMTGGMQDWNYRYLSCNEVTIELSDVKTPAESLIDAYWNDNRDAMLAYMGAVHMGVRGLVTDSVTGAPVYAKVTVAGNTHPVYSDPDIGDYHRLLLPGAYDITISAPGYSSRTLFGITVGEEGATRLDVPLTPLGEGIVFSSGVWTGEIAVGALDPSVRVHVALGTAAASQSNTFEVVSGPVVDLAFTPLQDVQFAGVPFEVTLSAVDANGFAGSGFSGSFTLQATAGGSPISVSPAGGTFENGVWSATVTLAGPDDDVVLTAVSDSFQTQSESFEVVLGPPLSLGIAANATEGDGSVVGTISLPQTASQDVAVSIVSTDPGELAPWQSSVIIPAGQLSVPLEFVVGDDTGLDGTRVATITITAEGYLADAADVEIHDNETTVLSLVLPASVAEVDGPSSATGTVSILAPAARDVAIRLSVSEGSQLILPDTVVIPAGHAAATFELGAFDDTRIDGNRTVAVRASVVNWTPANESILVVDDENRKLTIAIPPLLWEGESAQPGEATISLDGTLTYDLTLSLVPFPSGVVNLPATVIIPAGQSHVSFSLAAGDNAAAEGNRPVSVSVSALGFEGSAAQTVVADDEVDIFVFSPISKPQTAGVPFTVEVEALNIDGMPIAPFDGSCDLTVLGNNVPQSLDYTPKTLSGFTQGKWSGEVTLGALLDEVYLMVSDGAGHVGVSNSLDFTAGAAAGFVWQQIASPKFAELPFTTTLQAVDANGFPTNQYSGTVDLEAKAGLVGEVSIGSGTETCEFPLNAYWEDARTQVIYRADEIGGSMAIAALAINVTQVPDRTLENWTIRMKHVSYGDYSAGGTWESGGWVTVYRQDETFSHAGETWFTFDTPFAYDGTSNLLVDFSFDGVSYGTDGWTECTYVGKTRTLHGASDSGAGDPRTWSGTSPDPSVEQYIVNIRLQSAAQVGLTPASVEMVDGVWTGSLTLSNPTQQVYLSAAAGGGEFVGQSNVFSVRSFNGLLGDLDQNGSVGASDLDIVRSRWRQTVPAGSIFLGDVTGDGWIGAQDLDVIRANWGGVAPAAAARTIGPEAGEPKSASSSATGLNESNGSGAVTGEADSQQMDFRHSAYVDFAIANEYGPRVASQIGPVLELHELLLERDDVPPARRMHGFIPFREIIDGLFA